MFPQLMDRRVLRPEVLSTSENKVARLVGESKEEARGHESSPVFGPSSIYKTEK